MDLRAYYRDQKRLVGLAAVAVIAIVVAGWAIRGRSDDPNYLTAEVQRGGITSVVQATGTINPLTTVPVGSTYRGRCNTFSPISIRGSRRARCSASSIRECIKRKWGRRGATSITR